MTTRAQATIAADTASTTIPAAPSTLDHSGERQLGIQAKLRVSSPNDAYELEADRIADQVVTGGISPAPLATAITSLQRQPAEEEEDEREILQTKSAGLQRQTAATEDTGNNENGENQDNDEDGGQPVQLKAVSSPGTATAVQTAAAAVAVGGQALSSAERAFFEPRFGSDLSNVRLHTDATAARAATAIGARAYTLRNHIAFAAGEYATGAAEGRRLLAHELTHTLQQESGDRIQRDTPAEDSDITAREIFPVEEGARLQILRTMRDVWLNVLRSQDPATAAAFESIENSAAEVTELNDDTFEATISGEAQLPQGEGEPAETISNIRILLERIGDGEFELSIRGEMGPDADETNLFQLSGLAAERSDGGVTLSVEGIPQVRISPTEGGGVALEAFTAPYLEQIPEALRGLAPERLELVEMTRLPEVEEGSAEEQAAIEANAQRAQSQTRFRRQRVTAGVGLLAAEQINPMLEASWQINFRPSQLAGGFAQIPLRISLQYAPTASFLGRITSGFEASLSQLEVPINIQVTAGVAGGVTRERDLGSSVTGPQRPAFGFPVGGGVGLEVRNFRMDLRYDYLINVLEGSPNAHSLGLTFGGAF